MGRGQNLKQDLYVKDSKKMLKFKQIFTKDVGFISITLDYMEDPYNTVVSAPFLFEFYAECVVGSATDTPTTTTGTPYMTIFLLK